MKLSQTKRKKVLSMLDDRFITPNSSYSKTWESLTIEEKLGALAEKLDEVINVINEDKIKLSQLPNKGE